MMDCRVHRAWAQSWEKRDASSWDGQAVGWEAWPRDRERVGEGRERGREREREGERESSLQRKEHFRNYAEAETAYRAAIKTGEAAGMTQFYYPYKNLGQMLEKNGRAAEAQPLFDTWAPSVPCTP